MAEYEFKSRCLFERRLTLGLNTLGCALLEQLDVAVDFAKFWSEERDTI